MNRFLTLLALSALALAGCNQPAKPGAQGAEPANSAQGTLAAGDNAAKPPVASVDDIPANLKTDAYDYYGLACTKTLTYKFTRTGQPDATGTQKVVYKGVSDGNPTFVIDRSGDLAILQNEEDITKADGVYTTFAVGSKIDPPMLALPAKLDVGYSWTTDRTVQGQDGKPVKMDITNKIVGKEKLTVAAGEFDCYKITTTGQITSDKARPVTGTTWFAPGYGAVKLVLNMKDSSGPDKVDTIELTSKGD